MFGRPTLYSFIALIICVFSTEVSAAQKYTFSVGSGGHGCLTVLDNGKVRGVIRYLGKPISFSAKIVDGEAYISKSVRAGVLDVQFFITVGNVSAIATFGGQYISVVINSHYGYEPVFSKVNKPVSVNIRTVSNNLLLNGWLGAGKFSPLVRYNPSIHFRYNKKTGLVNGKLGSSPFIGTVSNSIVSAVCDNGTHISVWETQPFSSPSSAGSGTYYYSGGSAAVAIGGVNGGTLITGAAISTNTNASIIWGTLQVAKPATPLSTDISNL